MIHKFTPTQEQLAILDHVQAGDDLVVKALAGCAKTSTLVLISEMMHEQQKAGIYLAFNKSIATEAKGRMADSVECLTVHSLAYRNTDKNILAKLRLPFIQAKTLVSRWNISPVLIKVKVDGQEEKNKCITGNAILFLAKEAVRKYCNSSDLLLTERHCPRPNIGQAEVVGNGYQLTQTILSVAKKYWVAMINPSSDIPITHDTYLKLYSLSDCNLNGVDYIMGDEWQDSNPCTLEIVRKQKCQKIVVGDSHQNIYAFNGSRNALDDNPEVKQLYLSKSFRFGNNVEELARKVLNHLKCPILLKGNGQDYPDKILSVYDCYIYRTNTGCLGKFFELSNTNKDLKICLKVDVEDIKAFANHFFALKENKKVTRPHNQLVAFKDYAELSDYLEESKDEELKRQITLVEKIGKRIFFIADSVVPEEEADCVITTCHKVKGLEYNNVYIGDDFIRLISKDGEVTKDINELNLIYVGITRAKEYINVGSICQFLNLLDVESV